MKNRLVFQTLITATLLMASTAAQALTINPQIGINASALDSDPVNGEHKARAGWQVGGYLRFDNNKFYLQPGLFWHLVATELKTEDAIKHETHTFQNSVHSLQIPVLVGFNVIDGETFDLRLQAGTAIDFITSVDDNNYFTQDDLNSSYWSFKFAVGADFWILSADLGYDLGMSDYYSDEDGRSGKMNGWFLNAGLRF